jgi:hypothetical protein
MGAMVFGKGSVDAGFDGKTADDRNDRQQCAGTAE